VDVRG